jgi:hypothetical protein
LGLSPVKRIYAPLNPPRHGYTPILFAKYNLSDQVKNDMGKACSTYGKNAYRVLEGKPEGKIPLGGPAVGERIILRLILKK